MIARRESLAGNRTVNMKTMSQAVAAALGTPNMERTSYKNSNSSPQEEYIKLPLRFLTDNQNEESDDALKKIVDAIRKEFDPSATATPTRSSSYRADEESQTAVIQNQNVFEVLMDAVHVCSLGQISHALFEVGGKYRRSM